MNQVYKKDIRRFGERAFSSIEKNYSCGYKIAYLIAKFTKNDSYYRYRFYKAFRKYEASKNLIVKFCRYVKDFNENWLFLIINILKLYFLMNLFYVRC